MTPNLTRGALLGMLAIAVAVFWPTLQQLHLRWIQLDSTYAYGYFLLVLIAITVNRRVQQVDSLHGRPAPVGLLLGLAVSAVWLLGYVTQTQLLEQLALPAVIWSWVLAYFGWPFARALLPSVFLLYLAIPLWDVLVYPLRVITVVVVQWWIGILDIPVYIDGFLIEVPAGTFIVAGGCSGLNTLLMGTVISAFYAVQYLRGYRRLMCVALMAVLALVGNWIRVFLLVLIGYYSEMKNPLVHDHLTFGWVIFVVCLFVFFLLLRFIDTGRTAEEENSSADSAPVSPNRAAGVLLVTLVVSLSLPLWARVAGDGAASGAVGVTFKSDSAFTPAQGRGWVPAYQGYDALQQWTGNLTGTPVFITALTYAEQRQGKELVYFANRLSAEGSSRTLGSVPLPDGKKVGSAIVAEGKDTFLVLWTYRVGHWHTLSAFTAKMLQVPALFSGESAAGLITLAISCENLQCQSGKQLLQDGDFISAISDTIGDIDWDYRL